MVLIKAPDLTAKKIKKLVEAPNLTSKKVVKTTPVVKLKSSEGTLVAELSSIHRDISELHGIIGQVISAEVQTANTVKELSKERQVSLNDLGGNGTTSLSQKTIKKLKADIDWLITEIDRLNERVVKGGKRPDYVHYGEGITKHDAVVAAKEDADIADAISKKHSQSDHVASSPTTKDFKKVTNIYVEPVSGELVVIHEV